FTGSQPGGEKAQSHQRQRPHRPGYAAQREPHSGEGGPQRGFIYGRLGAEQLAAAFEQKLRRRLDARLIEPTMQDLLAVESAAAGGAAVHVLFEIVFLPRRQLAIKIQSGQLFHSITVHTKSPNPARIFCVARNKQFLAASSVVSRISPMVRSRMPW